MGVFTIGDLSLIPRYDNTRRNPEPMPLCKDTLKKLKPAVWHDCVAVSVRKFTQNGDVGL